MTCCMLSSAPAAARMLHRGRRVSTEPFDCIRGFGALQVAIGHWFAFVRMGKGGTEFGGGSAVLMFFVMSGFVMQLGYAGKAKDGTGGCCWGCDPLGRGFLLRRIARMGPLVWLSLLLSIPLSIAMVEKGAGGKGTVVDEGQAELLLTPRGVVKDYISTACFVQTWVGAGAVNGPLWSVCSQMFCYVLFPCWTGPMHTCRSSARAFGEACMFWFLYMSTWAMLAAVMPENLAYIVPHVHPTNKPFLFLMGMLCGSIALTNLAAERTEHDLWRWGCICNCTSAAVVLYWLYGMMLGWTEGVEASFSVRLVGEWLMAPVYALWLLSLTQAPHCLSYRIMCRRPFRRLGDWSFGIYCLHMPMFTYCCWAIFGSAWFTAQRSELGKSISVLSIVPMFLLVFLVSAAAHHYVEKPLRTSLVSTFNRYCCDWGSGNSRGIDNTVVPSLSEPAAIQHGTAPGIELPVAHAQHGAAQDIELPVAHAVQISPAMPIVGGVLTTAAPAATVSTL